MSNFEIARLNMVESQVRPNGITDSRILEAMAQVAREDFVPPERRATAYMDEDIELSPGRFLIEAMAFAKLNAGDLKGARSDFQLLSQSLDAAETVQQRANAALGLIDAGSAKGVAAVVKAAAALPPPMPMDPGLLMPPGPQGQIEGAFPQ